MAESRNTTNQPLDPSYLEGTASLLDQIDKRVLVVLRDNRNIIGMLRSCDQFNNLVLHNSIERTHMDKDYSETPVGIFVIRGDNVLLVGEVDDEKEAQFKSQLKQVSTSTMLKMKRQEEEQNRAKESKRLQLARLRGMAYQDYECDD